MSIASIIPGKVDAHIALELSGICKSFDGKPALSDATLRVRWGEVHALLGENGAGKSTIMNVATGVYTADSGRMQMNGDKVTVSNPQAATDLGIGMVHQQFRLVKRFTVAENILLACRDQLRIKSTHDAAEAINAKAAEVGFGVNAHAIVGDLSVAEQQRVEILKVLLLGAKIIILDEPTSVLTDQESETILAFVRKLAENGNAVILITHKLREVISFSHRVTIMRAGQTVLAGEETSDLTAEELAAHMVGEQVSTIEPINAVPGELRLHLENLVVPNPMGGVGVEGIDMKLCGGEILGIAGVGGNGQQQLADCLMGLADAQKGKIILNEEDVTAASVRSRRAGGLRFIPADRSASGIVPDMNVYENLAMTGVPNGDYGSVLSLSRHKMRDDAETAITENNIMGATPSRIARLLSGGNAQKLVLSRELRSGLSVLVAHSPTRGLDVKACKAVHSLIKEAVEAGAACLLISEDLEEVLNLSTRVAVMCKGTFVGEMPIAEASREKVGKLMLGHA